MGLVSGRPHPDTPTPQPPLRPTPYPSLLTQGENYFEVGNPAALTGRKDLTKESEV